MPGLPDHWSAYAERIGDERLELAGQLAECGDFDVESEGPERLRIDLYDDVRHLVGDHAIEQLENRLPGLDGVDDAVRLDREVFEVTGTITPEQLRAWLVAELAITGDPDYWDDIDG